jgi:hypothetical protein
MQLWRARVFGDRGQDPVLAESEHLQPAELVFVAPPGLFAETYL